MDTSPPSLLATLLRKIATLVWTADGSGYAIDMSEWSRLTGQHPDSAEGDGWLLAVHAADRERVKAAWRSAFINQSEYNIDYRIRCADGAYRWFNSRGIPIWGQGESVEKWIGVILPLASQTLRQTSSGKGQNSRREIPKYIAPSVCKAARSVLGWSTQQLALKSRVSASTVRRMESLDESHLISLKTSQQVIETLMSSDLIELLVNDSGGIVGLVVRQISTPRSP